MVYGSMKANVSNRKGAKVRISEIYGSIQGEGILTGTPSTFVRTSGCNLRCWFCDTRFASWYPEGDHYSVDTICDRVQAVGLDHVVLTGGEPMIYNCLPDLCGQLSTDGNDNRRHITIETAGTLYHDLKCDLMSISPKLSRSGPAYATEEIAGQSEASLSPGWSARHDARREQLDIVRNLIGQYPYQLKFVVDSPADAGEVLDYLERLGSWAGDRVLIMPQGTQPEKLDEKAQWLIPWCQEQQLRFCPRAHIHWFGNRRGT